MASNIFLVGNPNVGKSSVFNQITGIRQKTANYAGVTVERKVGKYQQHSIIDLPGLKSLWAESIDEKVSVNEILQFDQSTDRVIFVADGVNLAQDLFLFSQMADLQIPLLFVINFSDEIQKQKISIDLQVLKERMACPVLLFSAKTGEGLVELKQYIDGNEFAVPNAFLRSRYDEFGADENFQNTLKTHVKQFHDFDESAKKNDLIKKDFAGRQVIIQDISTKVIKDNKKEEEQTDKIDAIVLHPIWGSLIFFGTLLVIFQAIFSFSSVPMDMIDGLFESAINWADSSIQTPWLSELISKAILPGFNGIFIFIPQIVILFLLLGILESTGYLSRISYLSDRWLKMFGLSGSSVIPLLSGVACAIPAVMSARNISDERERLAAIMVTPFMTCSARLPVYTVLIGLIFPEDTFLGIFNAKGLMLFGMYLLGTLTSLIAAWLFTRWKAASSRSNLWVLDLPRYRMPHWRNIFIDTWNKTKAFLWGAGKIILLFSLILWFASTNSPHPESFIQEKITELNTTKAEVETDDASIRLEYSYAGYAGKIIEPVIRPLGYDWKIGIALLTSFAAREVFVGTISTIYSIGSDESLPVIKRLSTEINKENGQRRFNFATCISLLLFYAFAMQCISTIAIVKKETGGWKWPMIQLVGMVALAYFSALIAYQILS